MNLYEVTAKTLAVQLSVSEVPEEFVVLAKHQVLGLDNEQIAKVLGVEVEDIVQCEQDDLFKQIKQFVGGIHASEKAAQSTGWDAIESMAVGKLITRLQNEKDSEFLLRVAAVANRATRRVQPPSNVIDTTTQRRTTITLTQRLVTKIQRGDQTVEETKQVSIQDGTMTNPNFSEIDSLLNVRSVPMLDHQVTTRSGDPSIEELAEAFMNN